MDISLDYLMLDFLQTITFFVRTGEDSYDGGTTIQNVLIDNEYKEPLLDNVDFKQRNSYFSLWIAELNGIVPKRGDKIVDSANTNWNIVLVNDQDLIKTQKFCCKCQEIK